MSKVLISFVIPCYRSENTISAVIDEIIATVKKREGYDYEIVCINDCSPDGVYEVLKSIAQSNKRVKLLNLSKNMGKHAAVLAGYSVVQGDYVVNLDDDYQSPVSELWELVDVIVNDDCDFVSAKYMKKKQAYFKRVGRKLNAIISSVLLNVPSSEGAEEFNVMKRFVAAEIVKYTRPYPYLWGLVLRITRKIKYVYMEHRNRADGAVTGYTFKKSFALWVNCLTAFSVKPLRLAGIMGLLFSFGGFLLGIYFVLTRIFNPEVTQGFTSLIAINLLGFGVIMISLGVIGEYIGRIYICINESPQYVIKEKINVE